MFIASPDPEEVDCKGLMCTLSYCQCGPGTVLGPDRQICMGKPEPQVRSCCMIWMMVSIGKKIREFSHSVHVYGFMWVLEKHQFNIKHNSYGSQVLASIIVPRRSVHYFSKTGQYTDNLVRMTNQPNLSHSVLFYTALFILPLNISSKSSQL